MKHAPIRLLGLLGTGLLLWHVPGLVAAADQTGWDCVKTPGGAWRCNPGTATPAKPVIEEPAPAARLPDGPITPPASSLPPKREEPPATVEAKPEAEPAPAPATAEQAAPAEKPAEQPKQVVEVPPREEQQAVTPARPEAKPEPEPRPVATTATPATAAAEPIGGKGPWALCPTVERHERIDVPGDDRSEFPVNLSADEADIAKEGVSHFRGNVIIERADQHLRADRLDYDRDKETAVATGNVSMRDNDIDMRGDEIQLDLANDQGKITNADYRIYTKHGRGTAETLRRDGQKNITKLDKTRYTTCAVGNEDWYLDAEKIRLKHDEGYGTAEDVSVNFKGIPFFYLPTISFPIDETRKSGLLVPSIGSDDESGTDITLPFYWNIAPNRDATITPRILSQRGFQLGAEYRYLGERSEGQVNAEYLPSDNEYNDEDRYLFAYRHTSHPVPRLSLDANLNYVSDDDYFEDLGRNITLSSITHLERRLSARYAGDFWNVSGTFQGYQTIDDSIPSSGRPYQRLPQVLFNARLPDQAFGLDFGMYAEAVHFDRDNTVTGTRYDIMPSVSLPLRNSYGFITPKLAYRYTKYDLDNVLAGSDDSPDRDLPIFSIDSGLFFERDTEFGGRAITQTLEPRLYYLNIPERNQSSLNTFDTGLFDFSFDQLFRDNRFTGADRVGDANQLTAALTTRFIDQATGIERGSASIGQIYYFEDREVTLPGGVVETDSSSDIIAEISARLTRNLSSRASIQWDPHQDETEKGVLALRYQSDNKTIVNFGYRYRRSLLEQTDFGFSWPLDNQWNLVGRWNYSLDQERSIDTFAGLEYESCCWAIRLVGREYINDLNQQDENFAILLQLELKGLTSFGDNVEKFLGDGILGYGRDPESDDIF